MHHSFMPRTAQRITRLGLLLILLVQPLLASLPAAQAATNAATAGATAATPAAPSVTNVAEAEARFHEALNKLINTPADAPQALQAAVQRELELAAAAYEQAQIAEAARRDAAPAPAAADKDYVYTANTKADNGDTAAWTLLGKPEGNRQAFDQAFSRASMARRSPPLAAPARRRPSARQPPRWLRLGSARC